jgi:hypothetical protein
MSPLVKSGRDFDEALSTKRSPVPLYEPQHLPPPPPAPRLSLPALGSFTTPPTTTITTAQDSLPSASSFTSNVTTAASATSTTSSLDYDESYTAFYSSIPTVADSLYTAILSTPISTSTTTTLTTTPTTPVVNSNNPYLYPYLSYSTSSFTASPEYQYHASLGSKTPMQVVAMSNHKLNSDIYSSRSLSIHRRILVKNLLTLLYEMNPMLDWFDDGSGYDVGMYEGDDSEVSSSEPLLAEDEQNGWIEQTLSAAGLSDEEDDEVIDRKYKGPVGCSDKAKMTSTTTTTTITTTTRSTPSNLTKSADGRGSVGSSTNNDNKKKIKDTAAPGSNVSQSTPSIKVIMSTSVCLPFSFSLPNHI